MNNQNTESSEKRKRVLDKTLDKIGWGLFFIMSGGLLLAPEGMFPEGSWLIGIGIIVLGETIVRYFLGLKIAGFWVGLGILALAFGISEVYGLDLPIFPALIILAGIAIIFAGPGKKFDFDCGGMMRRCCSEKNGEPEK